MRFLIDESCDGTMGLALLEAGNDVLEIRVIRPGSDDEWVVNLALSKNRILLTEDKDFGWLIYAHGHKAIGVIFLRYPVSERHRIARDLVELVKQQRENLSRMLRNDYPETDPHRSNARGLIALHNQSNLFFGMPVRGEINN